MSVVDGSNRAGWIPQHPNLANLTEKKQHKLMKPAANLAEKSFLLIFVHGSLRGGSAVRTVQQQSHENC